MIQALGVDRADAWADGQDYNLIAACFLGGNTRERRAP